MNKEKTGSSEADEVQSRAASFGKERREMRYRMIVEISVLRKKKKAFLSELPPDQPAEPRRTSAEST